MNTVPLSSIQFSVFGKESGNLVYLAFECRKRSEIFLLNQLIKKKKEKVSQCTIPTIIILSLFFSLLQSMSFAVYFLV